ncbi:hypothetical protein EDC04DRAFT_1761916 [Pisolithus marmoratus]|nr:hypothetical protein EDC04DRAFT_1761916 [Pisolithus marmoratus]
MYHHNSTSLATTPGLRTEKGTIQKEHFYALMNMRQLAGTEAHRKSVNKWKKDRAIKFFSDLFCLEYLNYIGKITFFERLPSIIEIDSLSEGSVGTAEENSLLPPPSKLTCTNWVMICNLFNRRQQSNTDENSRLEERDAPRRYADEKKKVVRGVESTLQTLGSGLLEHIVITFLNAYHGHVFSTEAIHQASNIDYDRQLDIPSVVQEIKTLQAKLDEMEDEDEQRAAEEDVTGKAGTPSSCYHSTSMMFHSLIDPVALLVWDPCRSRRIVIKGCGLHLERRKYGGLAEDARGYVSHNVCGP